MPYPFKPYWLVNSFFFLLILAFVGLGIWQLKLANEKQALQNMIDQRSAFTPLSLNMPFEEFAPYQIVQATGQFRAQDSILLDSIIYENKPGFYLITPFEITASRAVILVNRGWIPQDTPDTLPTFNTPLGLITIEGHLNHPPLRPNSKKTLSNPLTANPPLWNYMDHEFFSQIHGYPVLPLILKVKENGQTNTLLSTPIPPDTSGPQLVQDWPNYDAKSNVHFGYSILWFSLALFSLVIYVRFNVKKTKRN